MVISLVAMTGLEKCRITFVYLQWLFHSGERAVARGPLVIDSIVACDIKVAERTFINTKSQGHLLTFALDASNSVF